MPAGDPGSALPTLAWMVRVGLDPPELSATATITATASTASPPANAVTGRHERTAGTREGALVTAFGVARTSRMTRRRRSLGTS